MEGFTTNGEREIKLSAEQLELVLHKAEDINREGTAFTSITHSTVSENPEQNLLTRFESVIQKGVLNSNWLESLSNSDQQAISINEKRRGEIYFNILGKVVDPYKDYSVITKIGDCAYISNADEAIAIVFSLENYRSELEDNHLLGKRELLNDPEMKNNGTYIKPSGSRRYSYNGSLKSWLWRATHRSYVRNVLPEKTGLDLPRADFEYGFALSHRIAPRLFRGFVIKTRSNDHKLLTDMVRLIMNNSKPEDYVPIYDLDGNMIWPREISHNEIIRISKNHGEEIN